MRPSNKFLTSLLVGVVLVGLIALQLAHRSNSTGTLKLTLDLPDTQSVTAQLNQSRLAVHGLQQSYPVRPGDYTLKITKPHYKNFSASFTITKSQTTIVTASLERSVDTTIHSWQDIQRADSYAAGAQLLQTTYFYDKTWALLRIQSYGSTAIVVVRYDDDSAVWQVKLGPGTLFTSDDSSGLPSAVSNYLTDNGYIGADL